MTSTSNDLASTYQKKTQLEHIKDAPDTYIGGIEEDRVINWTMAEEKMIHHEPLPNHFQFSEFFPQHQHGELCSQKQARRWTIETAGVCLDVQVI